MLYKVRLVHACKRALFLACECVKVLLSKGARSSYCTQLRAKKVSQRSPYARATIAAAPSSEPHLDIYFPIGSKTKGALQGPAFVRQYAPSIVRYYSVRVGTYFGGLGLKEGCFSLCFLLLLQYKDLYPVSKHGSSFFLSSIDRPILNL